MIGLTRIGVVVTDDSFGADAAVGALKGFEKVKLSPVLNTKFARENPDLPPVAARVRDARAQAVMVVGSVSSLLFNGNPLTFV